MTFYFENVNAQSNSDVVKLNIILHPVQTITVNSSQRSVDLNYITEEDYENGVTATIDDHLSVTSSGGFQVNVASNDDKFSSSFNTEGIPAGDVSINAFNGSENNLDNIFGNVILSTKPESLITSSTGGRDLKYSVTYDNSAGSSDRYINKKPGKEEEIYTIEVTYTITSKW